MRQLRLKTTITQLWNIVMDERFKT